MPPKTKKRRDDRVHPKTGEIEAKTQDDYLAPASAYLNQPLLDPNPKMINGEFPLILAAIIPRKSETTCSGSTVKHAEEETSTILRVYPPTWSAAFAARVCGNDPTTINKRNDVNGTRLLWACIVLTARVSELVVGFSKIHVSDGFASSTGWSPRHCDAANRRHLRLD